MFVDPKTLPTASQLEEFFFEAMNAVGWASDTPMVEEHPVLIGWMITAYESHITEGTLLFVDQWCDAGGFTTIELRLRSFPTVTIRLWDMHYRGSYPKHIIPTLKAVLGTTYKKRVFCCGRGPETYSPTSAIRYYNGGFGNFSFFHGPEMMLELTSGRVGGGLVWTSQGEHWLWGGMTFPEPQK